MGGGSMDCDYGWSQEPPPHLEPWECLQWPNALNYRLFLVSLLGSDNVYFQPPPTVKMQYPCIVYKRDYLNTEFADNNDLIAFFVFIRIVYKRD